MKKMNVLVITIIIGSMMLLACSAEPVEITVPADMIGFARDAGIVDGADTETINENGSITYVIPKNIHSEILDGVADSIDTMLAELFEMDDVAELFEEIEFNDDYTTLTVKMQDASANQLSLVILYPAMFTALTYQQFNGVDPVSLKVTAIDSVTGEVLETSVP